MNLDAVLRTYISQTSRGMESARFDQQECGDSPRTPREFHGHYSEYSDYSDYSNGLPYYPFNSLFHHLNTAQYQVS